MFLSTENSLGSYNPDFNSDYLKVFCCKYIISLGHHAWEFSWFMNGNHDKGKNKDERNWKKEVQTILNHLSSFFPLT